MNNQNIGVQHSTQLDAVLQSFVSDLQAGWELNDVIEVALSQRSWPSPSQFSRSSVLSWSSILVISASSAVAKADWLAWRTCSVLDHDSVSSLKLGEEKLCAEPEQLLGRTCAEKAVFRRGKQVESSG